MKRDEPGQYVVTGVAGEHVRAFIPAPLPPEPALDLAALLGPLERAQLALGRLQGFSTLLPEPLLFLYSYVRKEALLSSQIEGTQSSIQELLLFELPERPGTPTDDVVEVSNYVGAMEHGLRRMHSGFPLSNRLLREVHGLLMGSGRGSDQDPGHFRRSQNWIGGTRPSNAVFVPPPAQEVADCMSDLERFLHAPIPGMSELLRAGVAHVQFETIHPFLDGNGRLGRLLITFLLCHHGVLDAPLLYLSLYFKQHRPRYYELLDAVRRTGDWEAWLLFFLDGVAQTAAGAVSTAHQLQSLFKEDEARIQRQGRSAGSVLRVHQALKERPVRSIREAAGHARLSNPAAANAMRSLEREGIVRELTGRRRNRLFAYDRYVDIISEGT
ncbi:MAG: Fic family protein [Spirochaetaceae bacterium]|nr:Fic family protein [Spirochaetaceae bacterium]